MYILFDIGGTKLRVAASRDGATFGEPKKIPTPERFEEAMDAFAAIARELAQGETIAAIGGGIAGVIDRGNGVLAVSPHIAGWVGKPFARSLQERLHAPVYVENDAAVVGLGEAVYGAGKGANILAYLTVSTGVGGARLVRGKIDESAYGFEPGHQIVDANGPPCALCGASGDLESMISGTALSARTRKKPYEVAQEDAVWDELARTLAVGLHNTALHWSPEAIVLGGSMMVGNPAIPLASVRAHFDRLMRIFPARTELRLASLADVGGLWGALAFIKSARSEPHATAH